MYKNDWLLRELKKINLNFRAKNVTETLQEQTIEKVKFQFEFEFGS